MAVRRVTIFGGSGFIGRHLVKRLAAEGCVVRVAVRNTGDATFLRSMGAPGQIVVLRADVTDWKQIEAAVVGSDAVVNLVGRLYERGRYTFERLHAEAPLQLSQLCSVLNVQCLVHVSALGATERSSARYARSKAEGEKGVRDHFPSAVIFRPSVVFGADDRFYNFFASIASTSPILPIFISAKIANDGGTRFQPVYVGDVASAILQGLKDPACRGRTYELGGPAVYTMRDILELVVRAIDRRCLIVQVPSWIGTLAAQVLQHLPKPPLTPDQVALLQQDNVLSGTLPGLSALGIESTAQDSIVPTYLNRYRRHQPFIRRGI